jgi:hypothetical protein
MRSTAPSKVPTMCDQLSTASAGPCAVLRPLALRTRKWIAPPSANKRYCVFTAPAMVFSKMPPAAAPVGLTQASTESAPEQIQRRSRRLIVTTPEPSKLAALSPGTAPGASSETLLYVPGLDPAASAATRRAGLLAQAPVRQRMIGQHRIDCERPDRAAHAP